MIEAKKELTVITAQSNVLQEKANEIVQALHVDQSPFPKDLA